MAKPTEKLKREYCNVKYHINIWKKL